MPSNDKLSNYATTWGESNGTGSVQYHQTKIVEWNDSSIILRNNGYYTLTTKRKMNQAANQFRLNFSVYQEKGEWYVSHSGDTLPFEDGMILNR